MVVADAEPQMDLDKAGDYLKALMEGTLGLAHFVQVKDQPWTGTRSSISPDTCFLICLQM